MAPRASARVLADMAARGNGKPRFQFGTARTKVPFERRQSVSDDEIDGTAASSIDVIGSATIAGALQVVPEVAAYPHQGSYLILSAGSMSGSFSSINTYV